MTEFEILEKYIPEYILNQLENDLEKSVVVAKIRCLKIFYDVEKQ